MPRRTGTDQLHRILRSLAVVEPRKERGLPGPISAGARGHSRHGDAAGDPLREGVQDHPHIQTPGQLSRVPVALFPRDLLRRAMSFTAYYRLSSQCLITSGFAAVAVTGAVDRPSLVLYGLALAASWFLDTASLRARIPEWFLNVLVPLLPPRRRPRLPPVLTLGGDLPAAPGSVRGALKALTASSDRDYAYLFLVSFAQLLAASALTVNITFLLSLAPVLYFGGQHDHALRDAARRGARPRAGVLRAVVPDPGGRPGAFELFRLFPASHVALLSVAMTGVMFLLSIPLFLLLPRMALGIYGRPAGPARLVSGFSERVELGRGRPHQRVRGDRYARPDGCRSGAAARGPQMEGHGTRSLRRKELDPEIGHPGNRGAKGRIFKLEESAQGTVLLEQTFFLEALTTDLLFASHRVLAISSEIGGLQRDRSTGGLFTRREPSRKIRYRAVSDITRPDSDLIRQYSLPIPEGIPQDRAAASRGGPTRGQPGAQHREERRPSLR